MGQQDGVDTSKGIYYGSRARWTAHHNSIVMVCILPLEDKRTQALLVCTWLSTWTGEILVLYMLKTGI